MLLRQTTALASPSVPIWSLESDEAEETESDGAVLAASSRGGDGAGGTGKGALQDGFGKYTEAFVDDEYTYEDELDDEEYDEEFDPWVFIHGLPPLSSCVRANRPPILPRKSPVHKNKNTLVLDLDETLVHCTVDEVANADVVFPVVFNGEQYQVHVQKRPHVDEFLRAVAEKFEVVVFTASQRVYADKLLDILDPGRKLIKHRLFRDACLLVEGNYLLLPDEPWRELWDGAGALLDERWFVDTAVDDAMTRVMGRHVAVGRSAEEAKSRADGNDRLNGEMVWAARGNADVHVPSYEWEGA